jgi:hypothetical protein
MPVMALFAVAFLAALPVVGLEPLWATRSATALLLTAAAALVILINATYQDGSPETRPHAALSVGARLAALALVPLVAIAAFALWLRIDQHGLTPERIVAMACVLVAASYALGYAIAAIWPGQWLKPIEITNIGAAFVALARILALFTPIADPARIAVDDQLRRLADGRVAPEQFDFRFLRTEAARYGIAALERLKADKSTPRAQLIARKAEEALKFGDLQPRPEPTSQDLIAGIAVYPKGATLPESFVKQDWRDAGASPAQCVRDATGVEPCEAFFADFDGDGRQEILLSARFRIDVFKLEASGRWAWIGYLSPMNCGDNLAALRAGRFRPIRPARDDLEIDGRRVQLLASCESPTPPRPD